MSMPLVVIQTTIPDQSGKPFRVTEVLDRVAETAEEALEIAAFHIGDRDRNEDFLTARWHERGGYWLVAWEPMAPAKAGERLLLC